ncbi:hypothetical protein [Aestuariicoccus sp. MJ-SS9]|uniref:ArnT family glycosyltransferase n=1 Tax=Aestuariicoccus sp. MJ-SS9 TaxID=3079855 RepID=UPI002913E2D3|nr:hypothetical protein [Aestuariicoccus sp. MJ-SS9]MDU8913282.1 hypothetical protein [Aestuariicoccus sp. MJ-SS9]
MINRPVFLAAAFGALWLILVVALPAGLWVPDETVIYASLEVLRQNGGLFIDNGYAQFEHPALLFNDLLKVGPEGVVSQYPSGLSYFLLPIFRAAGLKGVLALSAIAAALAVWLTHQISVLLFEDRRVAAHAAVLFALCSYLVIYAKALWPHAMATAAVLAIVWLVLKAVHRPRAWRRDALIAGGVLGLGLSVRVDVVLAVPALLAIILVWAARPAQLIALAGTGALPGALLASWLNWLKFGVFLPASYGSTNGGTSLESYGGLALAMGVFLAICLLIRRRPVRFKPIPFAAVLIAGLAAVMFVPWFRPVEDELRAILRGMATLWGDMRLLDDRSHQVTRHPDGTLTVLSMYKKAVAQSMPWIGIIVALAVFPLRPSERFGLIVCTLLIVTWSLPFARISWHGGGSANMRYFLPVIPFVSILSAIALSRIGEISARSFLVVWCGGGVVVVFAMAAAVSVLPFPAAAVLQHSLPLYACGTLMVAAVFSHLSQLWKMLTHTAFAAAVWLSLFGTYGYDLPMDIGRRFYNAKAESVMAALPNNSFLYARVYESMLFQIRRQDPIAARDRFTDQMDPRLVQAARAAGYVVYVQSEKLKDQLLVERPDLRATRVFEDSAWMSPLFRIEPLN